MSAQVGAGGAVWTAPGAAGGRAASPAGTAGGALRAALGWILPVSLRLDSQRSLGILTQALSDLPADALPLGSFPRSLPFSQSAS